MGISIFVSLTKFLYKYNLHFDLQTQSTFVTPLVLYYS